MHQFPFPTLFRSDQHIRLWLTPGHSCGQKSIQMDFKIRTWRFQSECLEWLSNFGLGSVLTCSNHCRVPRPVLNRPVNFSSFWSPELSKSVSWRLWINNLIVQLHSSINVRASDSSSNENEAKWSDSLSKSMWTAYSRQPSHFSVLKMQATLFSHVQMWANREKDMALRTVLFSLPITAGGKDLKNENRQQSYLVLFLRNFSWQSV